MENKPAKPVVMIDIEEYLRLKEIEKVNQASIKNDDSLELQFSVLICGEKEVKSEDLSKLFEAVSECTKHIGKFEVDFSRKRIDETQGKVSQ